MQCRDCIGKLTGTPIVQAVMHLEKLWALNVNVTTRIVDCCTAPMLMQQVRRQACLSLSCGAWWVQILYGCNKQLKWDNLVFCAKPGQLPKCSFVWRLHAPLEHAIGRM